MPYKIIKTILIVLVLLVLSGIYLIYKDNLTEHLKKESSTKNMSYHTNIIKNTEVNKNFRKVLFTGANSQLVVMNIPPGGEIGQETHKYTEQTLFFLSGNGEAEIAGEKFPTNKGDVFVIVPGTEHNFRNTGIEDLKVYTTYSPPNHIDGRIHETKALADLDLEDEAVGENPPLK